jgi:hypothetical protein
MTDLEWAEARIPGSSPPARIARLAPGFALVRFPPGWSRPATGHYSVAEAFLVLDGDLTVSGLPGRPGDLVWLPPRATRSGSVSREGARVLAWFSGRPDWTEGEAPVPPDEPPLHLHLPDLAGEDEALPHGLGDGLALRRGAAADLWLLRDRRGPDVPPGVTARAWSLPDERLAPFAIAVEEGLALPWLVVLGGVSRRETR